MKPKPILVLYLLVATAVVSAYFAVKKLDRQLGCRKASNKEKCISQDDSGGPAEIYNNPFNRMISSTIK